MELDKWYKLMVESNTEIPPESVWEGIQDALDVDLVWDKVEQTLVEDKRKKFFAPISIAASVVLAVGLGGLLLYLSSVSVNRLELALDQPKVVVVDSVDAANPNVESVQNVPSDDVTIPISPSVRRINTIAYNAVENQYFEEEIVSETQLVELKSLRMADAYPIPVRVENVTPLAIARAGVTENEDKEAWGIKSAYVGVTGQMANTWLLSSKTISGLQPDELTATNVSFGQNFGVQLGASLTPRLSTQIEFLWISQNRQQYNEYINGKYVFNSLELDYYTFSIQSKYKFKPHHSVYAGGYLGLMKTAKQNLDGAVSLVTNEYSKLDYGIILGYEYSIPLGNRLTFAPGVFAKVGLNNVFTGNEYMPSFLNRTQVASLSASFSLSYNIF
ncbi:MAG: outer membrane beta-barrel protein [Tenuifilaceae bacterium]|jgi:hypothetical protein|nr:outer membrane beta-barrel protein [Tenuifilaceae bacterium]